MGQELVVPESFKGMKPAQGFAGLDPTSESLADGIGQSYAVIGYKGKQWSLRIRGERHNILRPDDGTPASFIDVVILGQAKQKSKSYYGQYVPGQSEGQRPICSSIDGVTPDADATNKQATACALCPHNVLKLNPQTNKKHKECTDYKRLAVMLLPNITKPLLGEPLLEGAFLRVPPASLNSLAIMGETMANQGFHFSTYITRISFNPDKAHPEMVFKPLQGLTDREAPVIMDLRSAPIVDRIIGASGTPASTEDTIEVLPPGTVQTGIMGTSTGGSPMASSTTTSGVGTSSSTVSAGAQPATAPSTPPVAQVVSAQQPSSSAVDTGFGTVTETTAAPAQSEPTPSQGLGLQTTADTGEPEGTDDDLDAKLASLISAQ